MRRSLLLLTAALAAVGCRERETPLPPPPLSSAPESTVAEAPDTGAVAVPVARTGTMRIEGEDATIALAAFDAPALPFTTFLPSGEFDTRVADIGGAPEVIFAWTRARTDTGDPQTGDPRATVTFAPPGVSPDSLLAAFVREGASQGRTVAADAGASPCLWAVEGHPFTDEVSGATGVVCVGTHGGRAFRVTTESDAERAEGFAARLDVLLREWRWRDTGLGLEDGPAL